MAPSRRAVAAAGHTGDETTARQGATSADPAVRATAIGALERLGVLTDDELALLLADPEPVVRRRAATVAARHPELPLDAVLVDADPRVVEAAAWACGEHERADEATFDRLLRLAGVAEDALVREAAVAALGAIGDERAVAVIVAAVADKPAVRRRAVLALAPFVGDGRPDVDDALQRALTDRNWQVRQAAEDLLR